MVAFVKMVRSIVPDSDEESCDEPAPYDFSSTLHPASAPNAPVLADSRENPSTPKISTQDDVIGKLLLGTGSTDSAVFQQIYNQHQVSFDGTLPTLVSQSNAQHQPSTIPPQPYYNVGVANGEQLTPPALTQALAISSSDFSNSANKKLKRSKTTIGADCSFTSIEGSMDESQSKMRRSRSVQSYPLTIEGSSQDIIVDVEDTGRITNLNQTSKEYRKMDTVPKQKDVYAFEGSSEPTVITKKVPAKTTMESLNSKTTTTYGKATKMGRSRTMVAPSSPSAAPPPEKRRRGSDAGRAMHVNEDKLSIPPPHEEKAPKRSLKENIQRKKEEKAAALKQKDERMADDRHTFVIEGPTKVRSPLRTYGKIKRSKTTVAPDSSAVSEMSKRSMDDSSLNKQKKRKSDVHIDEHAPFVLPQAKRHQRSKSITTSPRAHSKSTVPVEVVDLSSSQVDPVDQVPDVIVLPTASMPKPLLKSSTDAVLVPATKAKDKSSGNTAPIRQGTIDTNASVIVGSGVSVANETKASGSKQSSTSYNHPDTPSFDSSQERAAIASSVLKKVTELVNSPAASATDQESDTSSPLDISFDKGLVGRSIVLVPEPTDSQKEQHQAVSISFDDRHASGASLPGVMSAAKMEKWCGASSTAANSTWKERDSDDDSAQKRAPTMEPLSSLPQPSSRRSNKRSRTVAESITPTRRGGSVPVHSDAPPSSDGSDAVVKSGRKKIGRSKTMAGGDEPVKYSSHSRRTHVIKTITTYEKLKDPDESAPSFPDADLDAVIEMADNQIGSARGTKRKSDAANLDVIEQPQPQKSQHKSQEELDLEMARKLQEEMDREGAEPETRARRRGASSLKVVDPEPEPVQSSQESGLPPPEMYKPRLSSRRSKSLSAKADPAAIKTFMDALPRLGRKGKGRKAAKEQAVAPEPRLVDKENVQMQNLSDAATHVDASGDNVQEYAKAIGGDEAPKSSFNREKPAGETAASEKVYAVPKKIGRAKSKSLVSDATTVQDKNAGNEAVVLEKHGRAAKTFVSCIDDFRHELMMDDNGEPVEPKVAAHGRGTIGRRAASTAASAEAALKSKEIVDSEDDDDGEGSPLEPTARSARAKATEKAPLAKTRPRSKNIVDADNNKIEDETAAFKSASPAKAPAPAPAPKPASSTPTPLPKPRDITRQNSTPGFKAPTMARHKSTSTETDVPQTPRKDMELKDSQELTPKSTTSGSGSVPHSPLRGGIVPLRVGLSKRTRLPSLLKIIRKDK